ncbi:alpha/beta fold hydrolase [Novosphingobium malaysiense]|uniref:3-oxoadipate enol-lactone hydrolase n=1 Tax=Novosphingobium malaysiense TaxID=1348853 RepID=A0A0B1ZRB7_9SPHN|nr:alpha/beta hydrolase [Novosphingobium malaysiense]KHK91834.1 3-oxoadipate enol-lactone hydrolase [Novosphingobium malaysiense]
MTTPFRIDLESATLVGEWREGTGTPLVLVHGFGGSRHDWEPMVSDLGAGLPLITYDQRGFGDSTGELGVPFSHAEDLLALLDHLKIDRADLCGMSLGGATVLNFALSHPDRVRKLVLISPLMVGWSWTSEWIERWKQIGRAARAGDMKTARVLWWEHPLFDPTRASPAADMLRESIANFHGRQWVQDDQRPELPDVDRVTTLRVPTLLLTGALDTEDFRLIADVIAGAGQNVARIDHADAGHMLNFEIPGQIAGEIEQFLST